LIFSVPAEAGSAAAAADWEGIQFDYNCTRFGRLECAGAYQWPISDALAIFPVGRKLRQLAQKVSG
jgi:hypothetical protein